MLTLFLLGCLGAILGSFIALIAARYQPENSNQQWLCNITRPASHCSHCKHQLSFIDLIPIISWLRCRGRCRYCNSLIGKETLLVEIVSALSACLLSLVNTASFNLPFLFLTSVLILLSVIDIKWYLLPDVLTQLVLWGGLLFNYWSRWLPPSQAIIGVILGYLSLRGLSFLYIFLRGVEGMGRGDVKLFAALGAWCGWQSLPIVAMLAATLALAYAVCTRKSLKTAIPFGPWLALGGWFVIIIGLTDKLVIY